MKLPASGRVEILRQNESRGKCPLVVAADTGLTSGDGVTHAMIGGRENGNCTSKDACGVCDQDVEEDKSAFDEDDREQDARLNNAMRFRCSKTGRKETAAAPYISITPCLASLSTPLMGECECGDEFAALHNPLRSNMASDLQGPGVTGGSARIMTLTLPRG